VLFFFFTLVTGPRRSLRLKLGDTRVYEPQIRDLLEVEEEHLAGHEAALLDDVLGGDRQHADLGVEG